MNEELEIDKIKFANIDASDLYSNLETKISRLKEQKSTLDRQINENQRVVDSLNLLLK